MPENLIQELKDYKLKTYNRYKGCHNKKIPTSRAKNLFFCRQFTDNLAKNLIQTTKRDSYFILK